MRYRPLYAILALLFALVLLFRGLQSFDAYLRRLSGPGVSSRRLAAPREPKPKLTPRPIATPTPVPTPNDEELAALKTTEPTAQVRALRVLERRAVSPAMIEAVNHVRPLNEPAMRSCLCLRARFPGPNGFDLAIANLPYRESGWPSDMDFALCLLHVVADRATEDPERAMEALLPFAFSTPARSRQVALEGLRRIRVNAIPTSLRAHLHGGAMTYTGAMAALALGAERHSPDEVLAWLSDSDRHVRNAVREHLKKSSEANAPRILARALVAGPPSPDLLRAYRERETALHDVAQALAELALNEGRARQERLAALELLSASENEGAQASVESLTRSQDQLICTYAREALPRQRRRAR
jgi:hypothetical protein